MGNYFIYTGLTPGPMFSTTPPQDYYEIRAFPDGKIIYSFPGTTVDLPLYFTPQSDNFLFLGYEQRSFEKLSIKDLTASVLYEAEPGSQGVMVRDWKTPDEKLIIENNRYKILNINTSEFTQEGDIPENSTIVNTNAGCVFLLSAHNENEFYCSTQISDLETGQKIITFDGITSDAFLVSPKLSGDAKSIFITNDIFNDETKQYSTEIIKYDTKELKRLQEYQEDSSLLLNDIPSSGKYIVYSTMDMSATGIVVLDIDTNQKIFEKNYTGYENQPGTLKFSAGGDRLYVKFQKHAIVFNTKNKSILFDTDTVLNLIQKTILSSNMTPDGEKMVCMDDESFHIADVESGTLLSSFKHGIDCESRNYVFLSRNRIAYLW